MNIILIVQVILIGLPNYTDLAPDHSFIDVKDFESPKHLAEYLTHLLFNDEEYLSYFWWRKYFIVQVNRFYEHYLSIRLIILFSSTWNYRVKSVANCIRITKPKLITTFKNGSWKINANCRTSHYLCHISKDHFTSSHLSSITYYSMFLLLWMLVI